MGENYKFGEFHGAIKKYYENGVVQYETDFWGIVDFFDSLLAVTNCIGHVCGRWVVGDKVLDEGERLIGCEAIIGNKFYELKEELQKRSN